MIDVNDSTQETRLSLSLQLVMSVLRKHGEITVSEIEAIPLLDSASDVDAVMRYLLRDDNIEIRQRKVSTEPMIRWERVVRLRN